MSWKQARGPGQRRREGRHTPHKWDHPRGRAQPCLEEPEWNGQCPWRSGERGVLSRVWKNRSGMANALGVRVKSRNTPDGRRQTAKSTSTFRPTVNKDKGCTMDFKLHVGTKQTHCDILSLPLSLLAPQMLYHIWHLADTQTL
ncbi:hypothetical protein GGX14DRAFT_406007 [Mycena pura]|uniref:Uncharacterized protein n=1 Tax=Mycena pura TaxID=153505 RepID=A0AAD6UQX3_9AGAR|nr:hypothetical protein GGX14DRAFT_406007 [Mycena pura]